MASLLRRPASYVAPDVFNPKSHWHEKDIPDLTGKVAFVSGGSSGLGERMSQVLLEKGARVYVAARSQEKAQKSIDEIKKKTGKDDIHFIHVELGDLDACRKAGEEVLSKEQELDILVNNGGVMHSKGGSKSQSGHEMQWATNVSGPQVLTQTLLPALQKAAKSKGQARIVWISSHASRSAPREGVNFDVLHDGTDTTGDSSLFCSWQYGQSKLANILLAKQYAKRYGAEGILSVAVHPGIIRSPLWRTSNNPTAKFTLAFVAIEVDEGTLTQLWAATSPEITLEKDNGAYLAAVCRRSKPPHPEASNDTLGQKVWDWCEREANGTQAVPNGSSA